MFTRARLQLTALYLVIIMIITGIFSVVVYRSSTFELARGLRLQATQIKINPNTLPEQPAIAPQTEIIPLDTFLDPPPLGIGMDTKIFAEAKQRIILQLILINVGILFLSGIIGYFLAGKTLKPIEEVLDDQKRFVADSSHEIRTPLSVLKIELELAAREKHLDDKATKALVTSSLEEVEKIELLSNHLLSLSRYQNARLRTAFEKVKIQDILNKSVTNVVALAKQKNLVIQVGKNDTEFDGYGISLVELFTILLDNAVKYSSAQNEIRVTSKLSRKHLIVAVQDFGIGIKSGDAKYIFNRFYRADTSRTKTQVNGYGLGLSIAKSIVDLHKGKITVESTPGRGSTFIVSLPLHQPSNPFS